RNVEHDEAPASLLEPALAIGEGAVVAGEAAAHALLAVPDGEALEAVGQFDPIGADVLHRRSADGPRDATEVLEARKPLPHGPGDELGPVFAGRGGDEDAAVGPAFDVTSAARHDADHGGNIGVQHHVAAPAQHVEGQAL